ncbi:MAG: polysaccharide deacetylase family protein [Armatimonadota bacterium]
MAQVNFDAWPGDYRAAVSLTYDDGNDTQLDLAAPRMEKLGWRGTFYLSCGMDDWRERLTPWVPVHERDHEIGNHTIGHTCSRNFQDGPVAGGLEDMTVGDIEADVLEAERRLGELFPRESRSFAYPCYMTHVGAGETRRSYVPVIARHFTAGRGFGEYAFSNSPHNCDLACLWSTPIEHMRGEEIVGLMDLNLRRGRWLILTMHYIGGARLGTALTEFEKMLDWLDRHRDQVWVAPVAEIAQYLRDEVQQHPDGGAA